MHFVRHFRLLLNLHNGYKDDWNPIPTPLDKDHIDLRSGLSSGVINCPNPNCSVMFTHSLTGTLSGFYSLLVRTSLTT